MPFQLTEIEAGYLAGIIDGEGCIHVGSFKRQLKDRVGIYWQVRLSITNCDKRLMDWLEEKIGPGSGTLHVGNKKVNQRDWYVWNVHAQRAKPVLELVLPHLVLKKEQAELALEMLSITNTRGGSFRISEELAEQRQTIGDRMKVLNQRGILVEV